jgi:Uma2 family endonuclease
VLSPTTRNTDLGLKSSEYAAAGIEHYWTVDCDARTVTFHELDDVLPEYNVVAVAKVGQSYRATRPFSVDVDPAGVC